jgi:hypothetical protein
MVVDTELHEEEVTAGELGSPTSVAGASSCKRALDDEDTMVVLFSGAVIDEGLGWRRSTASER